MWVCTTFSHALGVGIGKVSPKYYRVTAFNHTVTLSVKE